ncbi:jg6151 [Pararge aegeria aegeria]|uniref:Jg6151 protein n=1 Tax=Pararge aegeria aegeria TaxID=348720 RepID=A0A8S4RG11_9NEOP|nr:jg6151 [Pararge aegeria aegeria]
MLHFFGSQSGNNGNGGSQIGNNGNLGAQTGNNVNTGSQSGNNGNIGQNNFSGSQNSNNGNSGSQIGNNGNSGTQTGNNGNSGSQSVNNGNTGLNIDEMNIERPCHVSFKECIKQYFSQHAKCEEKYGSVPDPLIRAVSTTFLTRLNLTLSATDVIYSGLNGNIEEFYINKATDKLVITIQFRNVTFYSKDTFYRFHRRAKEPVVNVDYLFINYRSVSTTTVIPCINDLQLDKSETYAYVDDASPRFNIGPKAFVSSDPGVTGTLPALLADIPTGVQEFFLTEAPFYAAAYIQHSICDFGLNLL